MIYQEPQIRVVVADDHPVTREGVVRALKSSGKIEVVASVADGRAALEAIRELRPAVALMDYKMPELSTVLRSWPWWQSSRSRAPQSGSATTHTDVNRRLHAQHHDSADEAFWPLPRRLVHPIGWMHFRVPEGITH
jgi:DNA-binding NarL/FixJ family response regulator